MAVRFLRSCFQLLLEGGYSFSGRPGPATHTPLGFTSGPQSPPTASLIPPRADNHELSRDSRAFVSPKCLAHEAIRTSYKMREGSATSPKPFWMALTFAQFLTLLQIPFQLMLYLNEYAPRWGGLTLFFSFYSKGTQRSRAIGLRSHHKEKS